jgi:hypothetical protein
MIVGNTILSLLALASLSASSPSAEPLVCNLNALNGQERERHQALGEKLRSAVVGREELTNGYTLVLDLSRLPYDAAGSPFCVVEIAEWVDLEARCCPFLDFGIELQGKGGNVKLRLTGGKDVKAFLKEELGLVRAGAR